MMRLVSIMVLVPFLTLGAQQPRPRARDLGISPGIFSPGPLNSITDVSGVRVGHATVAEGDSLNTGVTAILPHGGDLFHDRVPAAIHVGNGFGKLLGITQVKELGELETPILLTCTLCVWRAADAMVAWLLGQPGMDGVGSINPVVAETNDGGLNDIRSRPIQPSDVIAALESAATGTVQEGSVGAGRGTRAFGWKGGIGTASRKLPASLGGWTVGILVQTNFGGVLQIEGAPVGEELGRYSYRNLLMRESGDGSVIIVVATDAPLTALQLGRVANRGIMGLARTGSDASNGSGDYVIAFSTAESVRRRPREGMVRDDTVLSNNAISPVFQAVIEATEEAIYNSLLQATTVSGQGRTAEEIPIEQLRVILERHGIVGDPPPEQ
jgi:D-aminopeptidase